MSLPGPSMPAFEAYASWSAWRAAREADDERFNEEYRMRLAAVARAGDGGLAVRCSVCGVDVRLRIQRGQRDDGEAHRESMACPACGLPGRARAAFAVLDAIVDANADALMAEHGSAAWRQFRRRFPSAIGTAFHPERRAFLRRLWHRWRHGAVRHADLRALPFSDARFDLVVALEVFEHIEAIDVALAECARVIRRGGTLVATAPFDENAADDVALASTGADDELHWRGPEEWHADPVGGRTPCFHRFGWSLLDRARAAGFRDAQWCRVNAPAAGLFGLWVMRATR